MALGINAAAAAAQRMGAHLDPFKAYSFFVEVEGILVGGFTSVSGLESKMEVMTVREGGVNDKSYSLGGVVSYTPIVLESGITALDPVWLWYQSTLQGKIKRKNGSIYLLGDMGIPNVWYDFYNAWPTEWQGPRLDASQSLVATQRFVLAHEGIKKSLAATAYAAAAGAANAVMGAL
ncbi:phage tail protein [Dyella sp. M7H15-1]|uniref:phage tail protein n=1 Tax=Dyella sp. M7H15-1 TaxID=2501295 RepID=UPI0010050EF8|nr:phage tail protein [Dyella sp. M7H15-1]QAU25016.1 phage tail protein [Dyella sp. M7H15-1]